MRVTVLFFVLALGALVAHPRAATAGEKVKTNQSTKVYSRPGEHGKVLLKLKSGQNMTVLAKEGRWLKVRVQGRTGYVPRSKVDGSSDDELARNTRRRPFVDGRGTKRGFVGESGPDDRVGADAVGDGGDDSADSGDKGSASDDDSGDSKSDKADKGKKHDDDSGDDDDSDDDDGGSKATKASKASKAAKTAKASTAKKHDDDSDDDSADDDSDSDSDDDGGGKAGKADKGDKGDDSDDSDSDVDDDKTGEPEKDSRPKAHVAKKTVAHEDRNSDSDEQFTATPDMVLYPSDQKGKWTFVEDDEGDAGWVLTSQLEMDGGSDDDDGGGGGVHARQMDAHARLGVSFLQQGMRTAGATPPMQGMLNLDNYNIGSSAVTLALGGDILTPYGKKYVLGGEVTLDYAKTLLGGITVPNSTTSTGVSLMVFNLRAEAGYDFHKKNGMLLLGRLGYRYQSYGVDNYNDFTKNPAKLPQETIGAPTLGVALAIPQLTGKIGISASLDFVLAGASITQTKGLEDGASPSEKAVYLGGVFTYRWKKDMDLQATYNLDYASLDFGKPVATSMRAHTGTDVKRTDIMHTVTFGIVKGF